MTHCCQLSQLGCHVCGAKPFCGSCAASRALPLAQFSIRNAPPSAVGSRNQRWERSRLWGRRSTTGLPSSAPSTARAKPVGSDLMRTALASPARSISHCCHGSAWVSHTTGREPSSAACPASSALPHCRHMTRQVPPNSAFRLRRTRRRSASSSSTFNMPTFTVRRVMSQIWTKRRPVGTGSPSREQAADRRLDVSLARLNQRRGYAPLDISNGRSVPAPPPAPLMCVHPRTRVELTRLFSNPLREKALRQLHARIGQTAEPASPISPGAQRGPWSVETRLGAERIEALVADYLAGASSYEVAAKYGISKTAAYGLLKRRGVLHPLGARPEQCRQVEHGSRPTASPGR